MRYKNLILVGIGVTFLIIYSCSNENGGFFAKLFRGSGGSAVPVTVESVVAQEKAQDLRIPAVIEPSESVDVTQPEDIVIERVNVAEGDRVNVGDPLFKISEQEQAAKIAKRKLELKDAQTQLEKNSYIMKNRDRLLEEGRIDRTQYDNIETEVRTNETSVEKIQTELSKSEERAGNSVVTSPAAGVVGKIMGGMGTTITAGKPVLSITKVDPVIVSFRLPSVNAGAIKPGASVQVRFSEFGGESQIVKISAVGAELDPKDETFSAKVTLSNPNMRFKVGMRPEVSFTSHEKQRIFIISEEALIKERRGYFVFVVLKGVAHKVQVIPNETRGNRIEILRGLGDEDIVVVKGHDKLTEGTVVDIWGR